MYCIGCFCDIICISNTGNMTNELKLDRKGHIHFSVVITSAQNWVGGYKA
jgi:hypothetical protein